MYSLIKYSLLLCVFAGAPVFAKGCIQVYDPENSQKYCQKFSLEQQKTAKKYGLSLGMPYEKVKQSLLKRGWTPVEDEEDIGEYKTIDNPFMSCGRGWNTICWASFIRRKESIELLFGGNDTEVLLTAVFPSGSND